MSFSLMSFLLINIAVGVYFLCGLVIGTLFHYLFQRIFYYSLKKWALQPGAVLRYWDWADLCAYIFWPVSVVILLITLCVRGIIFIWPSVVWVFVGCFKKLLEGLFLTIDLLPEVSMEIKLKGD